MKSKLSWIPFIPLVLLACFLKLAQGLFPEGSVLGLSALMLDYLYMGAVVLIFLFAFIFSLIDKRTAAYYLPHRNIPACILGLLLAVALAADGADTFFRVIGSGKTDILTVLGAVFSLLSAIVFFVLGLNHAVNNPGGKRFTLLNVIPAVLCAVRMILSFVQFTTISIRLADVSSLICYVFATLFFFNYAVTLSLIKTKRAVKSCFAFGFPAAAALIPYGIYHLWFDFDYDAVMNNLHPLEMLLLGLYILVFLIELTMLVQDKDSIVLAGGEDAEVQVTPEDKVEGFFANALIEDENDRNDDAAYLESRDTEDFILKATETDGADTTPNESTTNDIENFLTEIKEESDENADGDDRPKDYESRLDDIDKLILEITKQSD